MQINIAICDDEREICFQIKEILIKTLKERSVQFNIDIFDSGENLCRELEKTEYDLIFLDIELPQMSGIEIGTYIRGTKRGEMVQIAYISSKQEYAMELFDTRPINFLVKPLEDAAVAKVVDTYMKITGGKANIFQYKKGYEHFRVDAHYIMYFVRTGRKVVMHTVDGTDEFYGSLEKIYGWAKDYNFLFIHKSYMVNYAYIKKMGYDHLVMVDDAEFQISQSRRKEIRFIYMKLVGDLDA